MFGQPCFHLCDGVGVLQRCERLHFFHQLCPGQRVKLDGVFDNLHVQPDAAVIDLLIQMVFVPDKLRHRESGQLSLNGDFRIHVPQIVCLEHRPPVRRIGRAVARPAVVRFSRFARLTEILDQVFAGRQLLLFQLEYSANACKGKRKAKVRRPDH